MGAVSPAARMLMRQVDLRKVLVEAVGVRADHADELISILHRHGLEQSSASAFLEWDDHTMKQVSLTCLQHVDAPPAATILRP